MEHFIRLYDWMTPLPPNERVVFAYLFSWSVTGKGYEGTAASLADAVGLRPRMVSDIVDRFVRFGIVRRRYTPTKTSILTVTIEERFAEKQQIDLPKISKSAILLNFNDWSKSDICRKTANRFAENQQNDLSKNSKSSTILDYNIRMGVRIAPEEGEKNGKNGGEMESEEEQGGALSTGGYGDLVEGWRRSYRDKKGVEYQLCGATFTDAARDVQRLIEGAAKADGLELPDAETYKAIFDRFYSVADRWCRERWDMAIVRKNFNQLFTDARRKSNNASAAQGGDIDRIMRRAAELAACHR